MQFKDHRFRNDPPKTYDIVIQLSLEEADSLLKDMESHMPDIEYGYDDCGTTRLWKILTREKDTRATRKENPGSYGSEGTKRRLDNEMWEEFRNA